MKLLIIPLLLLLVTPNFCFGERILFLSPMGSRSHKIFFMGITEVLAKRGHHITMVSAYEPSKQMENVREVVIRNVSSDSLLADIFEKPSFRSPMFDKAPQFCVDGLGQPQIQDLKKEKFDLIIISMFFDYCYLSFVHHFKVPFIYASASGIYGFFNDMINNIDFPAFTGGKLLGYDFPLSFTQRLAATGVNTAMWFGGHYYLEPRITRLCMEKGLCPVDMPSFAEINKNASLAIFNSVRSLENPPRPAMPNVIYAGGAHIKPSKPLPKDLEEWVQGSGEEGFIFFSLGSVLNPSYLPERYREILVKVFGSLKQRVLWKWSEDTMPNLPSNVKLGKWLPQTDILGHPKLRLFITHGGLMSTMESTYYGVPLVGMPVFADQHTNMAELEKEGWGKTMQWNLLEEEAFREIILEVLNTQKMKEISHHRSVLMKDTLIHPADEAAYWVEYVIKHKGAPHIMSPTRNMRWYEIYNMDVWAFIIAVFSGTIYLIWRLLKFMLNKCFIKSSQKIKIKKN